MEIQQSSRYANYLKLLGWTVLGLEGVNIFLKTFPFFGCLAKIQRFQKPMPVSVLVFFLKNHQVKRIVVEPGVTVDQDYFRHWYRELAKNIRIEKSPYLPTKTIFVDLKPDGNKIFDNFSEAKRRAVRRALKNNLRIEKSSQIELLIKIKNKSAGIFGFITTTGLKKLWYVFAPDQANILLAYTACGKLVSGVLIIFSGKHAYYWIAGSTKEGKKLFAPTLLVWEALKLAKKRGALKFDFLGVWDERLPKNNLSWKGFTKFKEGFSGKQVYYPLAK